MINIIFEGTFKLYGHFGNFVSFQNCEFYNSSPLKRNFVRDIERQEKQNITDDERKCNG